MTGTWAPPAEAVMTALADLRPPNEADRPDGAASWVMMWTLDGAGRITQGGAEIRAEPGTLVVLGSRTAHRYGVDPDQRHWVKRHWVNWWAHFQPRTAAAAAQPTPSPHDQSDRHVTSLARAGGPGEGETKSVDNH